MRITHGGFTASMIEYLARHYVRNSKERLFVSEFELFYRVPMKVLNYYEVKFTKENGALKFVINGVEDKKLYSEGQLRLSPIK